MPLISSYSQIINRTVLSTAVSTKNLLSDWLSTALQDAGWSLISGSSGSWTLRCAPAAWTSTYALDYTCRVIMSNLPVNCLGVKFAKGDGTQVASENLFLIPDRDYHIIANKYQFFVFTQGATRAREFICGGHLFKDPVFIPSSNASQCAIWAQGNANSDTDTGFRFSFRTDLIACNSNGILQSTTPIQYCNYDSTPWTVPASASIIGTPGGQRLVVLASAVQNPPIAPLADTILDDRTYCDGRLMFGATSYSDPAKIAGQIFDCYVTSEVLPGDTLLNIGGRTFYALTNNSAPTNTHFAGTLLLAVT